MSDNSMWDGVRDRLKERLAASGMPRAQVLAEAKLSGSYLSEFLASKGTGKPGRPKKDEAANPTGPAKKKSLRHESLVRLAEVLDCDVEYLYCLQDEPRSGRVWPKMDVKEVVALDLFHPAGRPVPPVPKMAVRPVDSFPHEHQSLYFVQDEHAEKIFLPDGSLVVVCDLEGLKITGHEIEAGDIVLVRQEDAGGRFELTLRIMTRSGAVRLADSAVETEVAGSLSIVGMAIAACRFLA